MAPPGHRPPNFPLGHWAGWVHADMLDTLLGSDEAKSGVFLPPLVSIGVGEDLTIRKLAELVKDVIGFSGNIVFDTDRPDGTPRELLDVTRFVAFDWQANTPLRQELVAAYQSFKSMVDA